MIWQSYEMMDSWILSTKITSLILSINSDDDDDEDDDDEDDDDDDEDDDDQFIWILLSLNELKQRRCRSPTSCSSLRPLARQQEFERGGPMRPMPWVFCMWYPWFSWDKDGESIFIHTWLGL